MPISLSEFKDKRGKLETIDYGDGDSIIFRWRPDKLTDDVYNAMQSVINKPATEQDPFDLGRSVIIPLVSEWDITDGKKPYALNAANVGNLGLLICMDIVWRINDGLSEALTKKGSSGG